MKAKTSDPIVLPAKTFCKEHCALKKECPIFLSLNHAVTSYRIAKETFLPLPAEGDEPSEDVVDLATADEETRSQLPNGVTFLDPEVLAPVAQFIQGLKGAQEACATSRMMLPDTQDMLREAAVSQQEREAKLARSREVIEAMEADPRLRALLDFAENLQHMQKGASAPPLPAVTIPVVGAPEPAVATSMPAPSAVPGNGAKQNGHGGASAPLVQVAQPAPGGEDEAAAQLAARLQKNAAVVQAVRERVSLLQGQGVRFEEAMVKAYDEFQPAASHQVLADIYMDGDKNRMYKLITNTRKNQKKQGPAEA